MSDESKSEDYGECDCRKWPVYRHETIRRSGPFGEVPEESVISITYECPNCGRPKTKDDFKVVLR